MQIQQQSQELAEDKRLIEGSAGTWNAPANINRVSGQYVARVAYTAQ
ncbi:MAG: hypothetical protein QM706_02280 [Nitrospira sp.]